MANEVVKITEVTNTISASLNDGSYNLLAGGTIGGNLQLGGTLTVGVNDTGHDVKFFGGTSGKYLQWDESADKLIIAGDLDVTGTTTSFNSTVVTIDDPVFTIGGDTAPSSDDNKDRGIEFRYHDGSTPRVGFFGYDDSESAFTFLTSATNSSEVFSGTLGNLKVNTVYHGDGTASSPSVRFNLDSDTGIFRPTANTLAFTTGGTERMRLHSDGNITIGGTAGQAMLQLEGGDVRVDNTRSFLTETAGGGVIAAVSMNSSDNLTFGDGNFVIDVTGTAERMRLDSNGRLGISTAAPLGLLQVDEYTVGSNGSQSIHGVVSVFADSAEDAFFVGLKNGSYPNRGYSFQVVANGVNSDFVIKEHGQTSERIRLYSSGLLQIAGTGGGATTIGSHIDLGDNQQVRLGASDDLQLYHDGTHSYISNTQNSGNLIIENGGNDHDIVFRCDDGSGGLTEYFRLDGSASSGNPITNFPDNSFLSFGSSHDFSIYHDSSNTYIANSTNDLYIQNNANDRDIIFRCDDGSGGVETYFYLDGSHNTAGAPWTVFPDQSYLAFGDSKDMSLQHNGSRGAIDNYTGALYIRQYANDNDIIFQSDDGSGGLAEYFRLDGGDTYVVFSRHTRNLDTMISSFGDSDDLRISHNGTSSEINNYTGNLFIRNYANDSDIIFDCDDGSGGTETYFSLKGSFSSGDPYTVFPDNSNLSLGTGGDLNLKHNGTNSFIENFTGDLYITNKADNKDIVFRSDDGSGGFETYFYLDGSASAGNPFTVFPDNALLAFGNSQDMVLTHNATDSTIFNYVGDLRIRQEANEKDILFQCDDGSGGVTTYFYLDGSLADGTYLNTRFNDNSRILLGTGGDLVFNHDGTNSYIDNETGDLYIRSKGDDKDIIFQSDDGSGGLDTYFYLDGSYGGTVFNRTATWTDNDRVELGTGSDLRISHDGTNSFIQNYTGNLVIRNYADDKDIEFHCDNGSGGTETYFYLDGSFSSGNPFTIFPDNSRLGIGTGADLYFLHNGTDSQILNTNGHLYIVNYADDKDIILQSDDGSGGATAYLTLDGSLGLIQFDKDIALMDNVKLKFGVGSDLQIYHDGSNSYIDDTGTGDLYIRANNLRLSNADGTGQTINANNGGAVELYHNNVKKIETTAAGVTITGDLTVSGSTNQTFNDVTVNGNLTVSGTTTTIDTANLTVEDKNIIIGNVSSPSDTTADGGGITLKGASDYTINWLNSNDSWNFNQGIVVGVDGTGHDVTFHSATAGRAMSWDSTARRLNFGDLTSITIGAGHDLTFYHNAHSYIANSTGNLYIQNSSDDGDIIFQSDDGSGGVETYFFLDGSLSSGSPYTVFPDDSVLTFGSGGGDLTIHHDGTDSKIRNQTGDLYITQNTNDGDIIFQNDDGSGGVTEYFRLDGGATDVFFSKNLRFNDNTRLELGAGSDLKIYHDGTNSYITNHTGSLDISNSSNDEDILFKCDDGSGGLATYFQLDGGLADGTNTYTTFPDNSRIRFGDGLDLDIHHDGSNSYISQTGVGNLNIQQTVDDGDIIFKSDDGSGGTTQYFRLDGGDVRTVFSKDVRLLNSVELSVGTNKALGFIYDGANSSISNYYGDLYIDQNTDDGDIRFRSDNGSGGLTEYFRLDGGQAGGGNVYTKFGDSSFISMGDGSDLYIYHNGTDSHIANGTGHLYITNGSDDNDIIFQCDDGSGGKETYFHLDGSLSGGNPYTVFPDGSILALGSGADTTFTHNGTLCHIYNDTGHFTITQRANDKDIIFNCDDGSGGVTEYFRLDGGEGINIFSKNVKLIDSIQLNLGGGNDLQLYHDGSNSYVTNATGDLYFINSADNKDITFMSDDGSGGFTTYFSLDGSGAPHPRTVFPDNSTLQFGGVGEGLQIFNDSADTYIQENTRHLYIKNNATDCDIYFQSDDGSGGTETYFFLDGSDSIMKAHKKLRFLDSVKGTFGNADDLSLWHSGSHSYINNDVGDLFIYNNTDNGMIRFYSDDGSGGVTEYVRVDGSAEQVIYSKDLTLTDGLDANFGTGNDLKIGHDGTNGTVSITDGDLRFIQYHDNKMIRFYNDDGSGGTIEYFRVDGSAESVAFSKDLRVSTGKSIYFNGTSGLRILHDGSNSIITNEATGNLTIQNGSPDNDVIFKCDNGSGGLETYFYLDGSKSTGDPYTIFPNNSFLGFGDDGNFLIRHTGLGASIQNNGGDISITQNTNDGDIRFYCDDNSGGVVEYFRVDGGASQIHFSKELRLIDGVQLQLGTDNDMQVTHNGAIGTIQNATGDLQLKTLADDSDMIFYSDDGSGSVAMYLSLDGGREVVKHHRGVEYNTVLSNDSDYTVTSANHVIIMHSLSTSRTVTIPTAQCNLGRVLIIKERDGYASSNNVVIDPEGSTTIDGNANYTISTNKEAVTLISDGSNWQIIGKT